MIGTHVHTTDRTRSLELHGDLSRKGWGTVTVTTSLRWYFVWSWVLTFTETEPCTVRACQGPNRTAYALRFGLTDSQTD